MDKKNLVENSKPFNNEEERAKIVKELEKRPYFKQDTLIKRALPSLNTFNEKGIRWFRDRILFLRLWTELIN